MLTAGRLKRIKSYISPTNGNQSASILNKVCCELVDEVERLRIVQRDIAAAPDLLAALQRLRDDVQAAHVGMDERCNDCAVCVSLRLADAALSKV